MKNPLWMLLAVGLLWLAGCAAPQELPPLAASQPPSQSQPVAASSQPEPPPAAQPQEPAPEEQFALEGYQTTVVALEDVLTDRIFDGRVFSPNGQHFFRIEPTEDVLPYVGISDKSNIYLDDQTTPIAAIEVPNQWASTTTMDYMQWLDDNIILFNMKFDQWLYLVDTGELRQLQGPDILVHPQQWYDVQDEAFYRKDGSLYQPARGCRLFPNRGNTKLLAWLSGDYSNALAIYDIASDSWSPSFYTWYLESTKGGLWRVYWSEDDETVWICLAEQNVQEMPALADRQDGGTGLRYTLADNSLEVCFQGWQWEDGKPDQWQGIEFWEPEDSYLPTPPNKIVANEKDYHRCIDAGSGKQYLLPHESRVSWDYYRVINNRFYCFRNWKDGDPPQWRELDFGGQ